ncbi:hypothetical protein WMY93_022924 [Mugilogobius chulae]|uniref:Uncharacterized protein n=1 Tax=Mugilogobius chulae TaxID=88201 RepID=A0AAW0N4H7_9GOBI
MSGSVQSRASSEAYLQQFLQNFESVPSSGPSSPVQENPPPASASANESAAAGKPRLQHQPMRAQQQINPASSFSISQ